MRRSTVTSIGNSARTRPKNKSRRRSYKRYRGQGRRRQHRC